ncbi:MAG: carboxypeptidase regulatory-like domain-containing protein [Firmicutes bacterium]|nr:carboxypeptidase regulatory-like domain-containing protein [Bacillota bacterium]
MTPPTRLDRVPRRFRHRLLLAAMIVLTALATSGCFMSGTLVVIAPGTYQLTGTVVFGYRELLMDGAAVSLTKLHETNPFRITQTDRDGRFSFSRVPGGFYTLTVDSHAGLRSYSIHVNADQDVWVNVPYPSWIAGQSFNEWDFLGISGLWDWRAEPGGLVRESGRNVRWMFGTQIPVFIDDGRYAGPDWPVPSWTWRNAVLSYLTYYWRDLPVAWTPVEHPEQSQLFIQFCPAGFLGPYAIGLTQLSHIDGYVFMVIITVDERYADLSMPVFYHELWHSIGVGHVNNPYSVMYPVLHDNAYWPYELSPAEKEYLWLAYAIRPNQTVPVSVWAGTAEGKATRATAVASVQTTLTRPEGYSKTVPGIPEPLRQVPQIQKLLSETKMKSSGGFLWDEIEIGDQ